MSAFLDTNVLIRHLTGDPADVAVRATAYLRTAPELFLTDLVVAETIYVLESYFEAARLQIAESIRALLAMESIVCRHTSLAPRDRGVRNRADRFPERLFPLRGGIGVPVGDDGGVADIKRGRAARNAKLATLPVGFAGRAALGVGKRLTGKSWDEVNAELMDKAAQQLFTVLGDLKGGAMKVGQALSVMEAAIPEQYGKPYREALTKLQKDAPPLPAAKVHRVLDAQLGTKWRERFNSFDDTPVASASIGQVHKAVWHDGREVAVKIQYPGADEALRADLKTMQRMVGMLKQLSPGADVQGVVDELIERTEMELDYRLEAENQRAFAMAYEGDPHFVVPHIVASAPKVVIQEWIDGIPLSQIIRSGTAEQRDLMGTRLAQLTYGAPTRLQMIHGDAHPGNFMLMADGKMGVIDFGAVAPLPGGWPIEFGQMLRHALEKDYENLLATMEKIGFIQPGEKVSVREIDEMLRQYVEPVQTDIFHYTRKWLQKMAAVQMDRSVAQIRTARQLDLPPRLAIPMRVIASNVAISCQLDAHVAVKSLALQYFPGFAEPEAATTV